MSSILIKSATIVNEGKSFVSDLLIKDGMIQKIDKQMQENNDFVLKLPKHTGSEKEETEPESKEKEAKE